MHKKKNQVRTCYIIQFCSKMQILRPYLCHIFYCYTSCCLECHISVKVFKNQPRCALSRPYIFEFFKDCLPQILLGTFFEYSVSYDIAWCFPHMNILEDFKSIFLKILEYKGTQIRIHLTYSMPLVSFYSPWKRQKTFGCLIFSGGIKRERWPEMG